MILAGKRPSSEPREILEKKNTPPLPRNIVSHLRTFRRVVYSSSPTPQRQLPPLIRYPSEMPLPVPFELRGKPKEKKADESDDGKKKKFGTAARSLGF